MLRAVMLWAALTIWAVPGLCQPVTLTSRSGETTLSGTVLGYDGRFLRVQSDSGEVTVPLERFTCAGPGCPETEFPVARVTVSGAEIPMQILLPPLIRAFARREGLALQEERLFPGERIYRLSAAQGQSLLMELVLRDGTSDQGIADLLTERADLALSFRQLQPHETAQAVTAGLGDFTTPGAVRILALDAVVPVVAPGGWQPDLPLEQLPAILDGRIRNWAVLGGPERALSLLLPTRAAGVVQALARPEITPGPGTERHRHPETLGTALRRSPGGLGFLSRRDAGHMRVLPLRDACDRVLSADPVTIRAGIYPLTLPVVLLVPEHRPPELMRRFLTYIRSPDAQPVIAATGYMDQRALPVSDRAQAAHLHRLTSQPPTDETLRAEAEAAPGMLQGLRWLAMTFRFQEDGRTLTPAARSAVQLLATALVAGQYGGERLVLIGFSDSSGDAAANLELSRTRAETLRQAILSAMQPTEGGGPVLETLAAGEFLPVSCEQTERGRGQNRRVELWLAPGSDE